ncbi:cation:dicarboxylase symporter family transporter [Erythrobacter arachoides]|uniref:Cation:dicarboxylase symporter family transporter n=1 Tax=Aurantiacibacter arachoides TaxID=1850444 RepID=A0A845A686_9SPHN|nr:cation:dicarboxylase symporter family transporter [Aurantiacibacter arachoides]MXO94437.1 cation:dicarboxylase symporter family transporter [Aurantiacibacter arachoides]GGD63422.1 hypothetical protein GCM10011411_24710 [Aurantiacibacter arachoides]
MTDLAEPTAPMRRTFPLAAQILAGLAVGAAAGLGLAAAGRSEGMDQIVGVIGLGGKLWLRALQMTILPLVFGLLATLFLRSSGIGSGDGSGAGGRTARRALGAIGLLYLLAVPVGVVLAELLLGAFPVTEAMARAMRSLAGGGVAPDPVPWAEAVLAIIPANVVEAMAGPTLVPVLFFALVFGAALAKLPDGEGRRALSALLTGLTDAMFVIVGWVIRIAPLGVALLVLPTTYEHGADIFAGLAHWIALMVAAQLTVLGLLYLLVATAGRVPLPRFARAMLPTQVVAVGTQSSTGCMPLTIESCRAMGLSERAIGATVPLAATTLRMSAPMTYVFVAMYAAQVYGSATPSVLLLLGIGLLGGLLEIGSAGIPSAATFVARLVPLAAIVGFPIEFAAVLLVVEVIPDVFKTLNHVTAHAVATALVDRPFRTGAPDDGPLT